MFRSLFRIFYVACRSLFISDFSVKSAERFTRLEVVCTASSVRSSTKNLSFFLATEIFLSNKTLYVWLKRLNFLSEVTRHFSAWIRSSAGSEHAVQMRGLPS